MRLLIALTIALALFILNNRAAVAAETAASNANDAPAGEGKPPLVKLETSLGDIVLELNRAKAPVTVENFLSYVKNGFYDGTLFHRVINGFMIQGGGMDANMEEKPTGKPIKNEAANGLTNDMYTIAMARTNDPNSATSQFFINVKNNPGLNRPNPDGYGYAVFGRVVDGMDVVDRIKAVPTGRVGFHDDVPRTPVLIKSATVVRE